MNNSEINIVNVISKKFRVVCDIWFPSDRWIFECNNSASQFYLLFSYEKIWWVTGALYDNTPDYRPFAYTQLNVSRIFFSVLFGASFKKTWLAENTFLILFFVSRY